MPEKSVSEILEAWRALEREQSDADPEGARYGMLELEIARLRSDYHRLTTLHIAVADQLRAAARESARRVSVSAGIVEESRAIIRHSRRRREENVDSA